MSFLAYEHSVAEGQPINLYQFERGNGEKIYRYCSADRDITFNNVKWSSLAISDSGRKTGENLTVTLPSDNPIALLYRGVAPSSNVKVTVARLQYGAQEARIVWIGTVIEAQRPDVNQTQLVVAGLSNSMQGAGLRLTWGKNCPYSLYDTDCKVVAKNFAVDGLEIKALNGTTITLNLPESFAQGWFNAGFIEWYDSDGVREVRAVTVHKDNRLTLMGGTYGLAPGMSIKAYPGCDGQASTCLTKFNNILNFGGIPHMPGTSPYDGSRVF